MQFVGSSYEGQTTADGRRFDGLGQYTFVNGDRYVGGFCDGQFHGHGVIFFRKRPAVQGKHAAHAEKNMGGGKGAAAMQTALFAELMPQAPAADHTNHTSNAQAGHEEDDDQHDQSQNMKNEATKEEDEGGAWEGQYRGVWQHGRNVSGCYVYADGLVYGGQVCKNSSAAEVSAAQAAQAAWPYCQSSDHRLWEEHLRHVTPVLPYETILGGTTLLKQRAAQGKKNDNAQTTSEAAGDGAASIAPHASSSSGPGLVECWAKMPIIVPTSCEQEMVPGAFANGQPRGGSAVPARWWEQCGRPSTSKPQPCKTQSGKEDNDEASSPCANHRSTTSEPGGAAAAQCVMQAITQPTPPLLPEVDPDHYELTVNTEQAEKGEEQGKGHDDDDAAAAKGAAQEKCRGRRVENPNLRERYPLDITDGSRRLAK